MKSRSYCVLVLAGLAVVACSEKPAEAGGAVVYSGAYGATVYSPPLYPAYGAVVYSPPLYPAQGAVVYSPPLYQAQGAVVYSPPLYSGYSAPAPVSYPGGYIAPYPPVAPIGHALIHPRDGLEIEYKYRKGLWYVEVD